jgi:hypothetical protein
MRILFTGSRGFTNREELFRVLRGTSGVHEIVHGGAQGADSLVAEYCHTYAIPEVVFIPDWDTLGKRAGNERNTDMVNYSLYDGHQVLCIAAWDGKSRGTLDCLSKAVVAGIPARVVPDVQEEEE